MCITVGRFRIGSSQVGAHKDVLERSCHPVVPSARRPSWIDGILDTNRHVVRAGLLILSSFFYDSHSVAAAAAVGCHWHIPCRGNSRRAKEGCLVRVASSLDRFALATSPGAVAWQPSFTSLLEEEKYYKCHWQLELMSLCLLLLLGAWVAFSLKWLAVDRSSPVPQSKTSCS